MNYPRFSYTTEHYEAIVTSTLGVEILIPIVMVLGGGAFGKRLGHEGETLKSEISALIKRTPKFLLPLSSFEGGARGRLL